MRQSNMVRHGSFKCRWGEIATCFVMAVLNVGGVRSFQDSKHTFLWRGRGGYKIAVRTGNALLRN